MEENDSFETPPRTSLLERVTRHPLEDTGSNASSSVHTASLIQSAARSFLDDSSQGMPSPDDDSTLQSLRSERLPALPDEQDRKRFVGCLAAVLARSYSYDCDRDTDATDGRNDELMQAEAQAFSDSSNHDSSCASDSFEYSEDMNKSSKTSLATKRHRKRRYDVYSQLLLSSADLLMIEKSQAKAFLPMLSKLLVPNQDAAAQSACLAEIDDIQFLRPFLESLTPGAGFRCLSLFLLQHLLLAHNGYDARIRHAVKTLGVIVLMHDMENDPVDVFAQKKRRKKEELVLLATRKFESLEHWIAWKLLMLSKEQQQRASSQRGRGPRKQNQRNQADDAEPLSSRQQMLRHLKIGGTAVVAGTLFAVTGGLAAPGIAAGVAALAGGTAATAAAAAVLTSTAAVTAIFGVGGGSLAAYKMQRRTQGLTEFTFHKESTEEDNDLQVEAELFSTICISGWLRDKYDFQRPWGLTPTDPALTDRQELLERFYAIYKPDHIPKSAQVLEHWEGEEDHLWELLEQKYGRNPSNLFPLPSGPRVLASLTLEQKEIVGQLFVDLGYEDEPNAVPRPSTPLDRMKKSWRRREQKQARPTRDDRNYSEASFEKSSFTTTTAVSSGFESVSDMHTGHDSQRKDETSSEDAAPIIPKHVATVWDYRANYGGELYTVKWESQLLTELCDSVADLAFDLVSGGTAQLLKHTALSTLLSAFAWPYALVNAANMIDGTWTLAVERADEAGKELARSLLFSSAGHRPVTLIGYSFGGRAVYSCLKELSRYQEIWEDQREQQQLQQQQRQQAGTSRRSQRNSLANMREPASIVEDAIIMGLPNHLSLSSWKTCRQVVCGRLVNCFSQKDMILSLMFQFKRFGLKSVCGVCEVKLPGVENVDVTDLVSGHQDYCLNTGEILKRVKHGQPFASMVPPPPTTTTRTIVEGVSKLDI